MSGHPVHFLAAAAIAAAASLVSISAASAGCYSCGPSVSYAPVAYYTAPVVYSYSYAAPAASCGCGTSYGYVSSSYGYAASAPMYVVNQGPNYYNPPVTLAPEDSEPAPAVGYDYGYRRAYPYYSEGGVRWHHRHWHRGYGYRSPAYRYGYRAYGYRSANRGFSYRGYGHHRSFGYRAHYGVGPGMRYSMRHPMVGPGGIYRGDMHHMHRAAPGFVHPRMMGGGPRGPVYGPGPRGPMKRHY